MTRAGIDPDRFRTPQLDAVLAALTRDGAVVRLVGGCVRNLLLDEKPGDVDIAIDARPEETVKLLDEAGIAHQDFGIRFGTVMATPGEGRSFEVTSLREDIRTDGRWPEVIFGSDWTADARRRDFTLNALYAEPDGALFDPLGGLPDLLARRVRFVGDPDLRIREDALRILRFYRFFAQYGRGEPDETAAAACVRLRGMLARLSRFRVGREVRRLLGARDPGAALRAAEQGGVLAEILPQVDCSPVGRLVAAESELDLEPDWLRRWLAIDSGKEVERAAEALNLSKAEARELRRRRRALEAGGSSLERGYRYGAAAARDALLVEAARGRGKRAGLENRLEEARRGGGARLPLRADDLLGAGWKQGPAIGKALSRAERLWLEGDLKLDRRQLLRMLDPDGCA